MTFYASDPAVTSGPTEYDITPDADSGSTSSSDPAETTSQQGGEHTYDVDDSVDDDPALDYSSINDPRQTAEDTTGTAGGEVDSPTQLDPMTGGTIAGGLDPSGPDSDGDGLTDQQEDQVDAVSDVTHDDSGAHTTDQLQGDPVEMVTAGEHDAEDAWNAATPNVPGDQDGDGVPDIALPDVTPTVEIGGGWKAAAAIGAAALLVGGTAAAFGGGA